MRATAIDSTIARRLLVNYRIDPEVVAGLLPPPFRPQTVGGWAVGGVCFIRLTGVRPRGVPAGLGLTTENAAHRFAVEWDEAGVTRSGVYIPRRDTNSRVTTWAGGRVFPGEHGLARFEATDDVTGLRIAVTSDDGAVRLDVATRRSSELGSGLFGSTAEAVDFFRRGTLGYSPGRRRGSLEGVLLRCDRWTADPVVVDHLTSSVFDDPTTFPPGSCRLDSGLVMRNLDGRWGHVPGSPGATGARRVAA